MQAIMWFNGGPSSQKSEPASLLDGWKAYEAQSQGHGVDVESGGGSAAFSTSAAATPAAAIDAVSFLFQGASDTVSGAFSRSAIPSLWPCMCCSNVEVNLEVNGELYVRPG